MRIIINRRTISIISNKITRFSDEIKLENTLEKIRKIIKDEIDTDIYSIHESINSEIIRN